MTLDCFINSLLLGDPDETLSSRFGRGKDDYRIYKWICLILSFFDRNHCDDAIEINEGDDQLTPWEL